MKEEIKRKLTSRKFWLSVAAFLGAIGVSISGIATGEKWVTITGMICSAVSAALYTAFEAYTDAAHVKDGE
jgi:drug/metabolite transporter (DMT)-like permease